MRRDQISRRYAPLKLLRTFTPSTTANESRVDTATYADSFAGACGWRSRALRGPRAPGGIGKAAKQIEDPARRISGLRDRMRAGAASNEWGVRRRDRIAGAAATEWTGESIPPRFIRAVRIGARGTPDRARAALAAVPSAALALAAVPLDPKSMGPDSTAGLRIAVPAGSTPETVERAPRPRFSRWSRSEVAGFGLDPGASDRASGLAGGPWNGAWAVRRTTRQAKAANDSAGRRDEQLGGRSTNNSGGGRRTNRQRLLHPSAIHSRIGGPGGSRATGFEQSCAAEGSALSKTANDSRVNNATHTDSFAGGRGWPTRRRAGR